MIGRIIAFIILVPMGLLMVALAVSNRGPVTVALDPLSAANPAYVVQVPLYLLLLSLVIVGVLVGGVATWARQGRWRRKARRLAYELRRAHDENNMLKRQLKAAESQAAEARAVGAALGTARPADHFQPLPLPPPRALPPAA